MGDGLLSGPALEKIRQRVRVLLLLDAAERAGIAPLKAAKLHAFAYLADVLSPVWGLLAYSGTVFKNKGGPHYPEFQREVDYLVVLGLLEVSDLTYVDRPGGGARVDASYALCFSSTYLRPILSAAGAAFDGRTSADRDDRQLHDFLVELAGALATLRDDEIDVAATVDATYSDTTIPDSNVIDFASWSDPRLANRSALAVDRFREFLPEEATLSRGEKLYIYASYLGRRAHA